MQKGKLQCYSGNVELESTADVQYSFDSVQVAHGR